MAGPYANELTRLCDNPLKWIHKIPIHKVMVNRSHNVLHFQILLGTDALPGCIRTDSALAAPMKASALTVGCRYVGVYTSVGGTFPAMDPDHAQRQGWIWYQRLFVPKPHLASLAQDVRTLPGVSVA